MSESAVSKNSGSIAFWADPPWAGGARKYRLGLRPISIESWLKTDPPLLANKQSQLANNYTGVVCESPDFNAPDLSSWNLPWQPVGDAPHWIARLGAGLAEDICLLDIKENHRLIAGCLAAPSYWSLHDKMGHPIHHIHAPVEGMNARIGANIERFFDNMPLQQPFYRHNWFVHDNADYFPTGPSVPKGPVEDWIIRSEQQVLYRPEPRYLIFTIRVLFAPLADLKDHPRARLDLQDALQVMDGDEVQHFGGVAKHQRLADYVAKL